LNLLKGLASNVSPSTANFLSYMMLVMVAIFLLSGAVITYIYYKKNKRENVVPQTAEV
jgi:preprotein translocase subunit SecG